MVNIIDGRGKAEIAVVVIGLTALWYMNKPTAAPVGIYVPTTPAAEVRHDTTQIITPKKLVVYDDAKEDLGLPANDIANTDIAVIAANTVPCTSDNPKTVVTEINKETGAVTSLVKDAPLPWLAAEATSEAGISYGIKDGLRIGRLTFKEDLVQVKSLHLGINTSLDSDGSYFVGAGITYRF